MNIFLDLFFNVMEEDPIYGIMVMGVYITYWILGFLDLSAGGTLPLDACVTGALIVVGANSWVACLAAFLAGTAADCVTGLLRIKLHVADLSSGILVMAGLWSVNLVATRGSAVLPFYNRPTIFTSGPIIRLMSLGIQDCRVVLIVLLVVVVVKVLLDLYLRTESGLLFRAPDNNSQYVISLGEDPGRVKIVRPTIDNGCTALAGFILTQRTETTNIYGGTSMVVMALASIIIDTSLFGKIKFIHPTAMAMIDVILYKTCLVIAMQLSLPTNYLKLLMVLLFTLALVGNQTFSGGRKYPYVVNPTQI